jgi:hypothetical protein
MPDFVEPAQNFTVEQPKKWRPLVKSGYFYVQDREYYLYAKKVSQHLKDLTATRLPLTFDPKTILSLKVDGIEYTNYKLTGKEITVRHRDLEAYLTLWIQMQWDEDFWDYLEGSQFTPDTEIEVEYTHCVWDGGSQTFSDQITTDIVKIKDGETFYNFEVKPVSGAPVVITDDKILTGNHVDYAPNFSIDYETGDMMFHGQGNLVDNSDFCDWELDMGDQHALGWIDPTGVPTRNTDAFYGPYSFTPTPGSYAFQQPEIDYMKPYTFGASICGSGSIQTNFVNSSGNYMDVSGAEIAPGGDPYFSYEKQFNTVDWERISFKFGDETCELPVLTAPSGTIAMEVRLVGGAKFDAISLIEGYDVFDYVNDHSDLTVEYEVDPSGLYTYDPRGVYVVDTVSCPSGVIRADSAIPLTDLNMNPVTEERHHGFLYIEDDLELLDSGELLTNSKTDFGLGLGGFELIDGSGVQFSKGRYHYPYAKTRGKGKFNQTAWEWCDNPGIGLEITEFETHGNFAKSIISIEVDPPFGSVFDSGTLKLPMVTDESILISAILSDELGNGPLSIPVKITVTGGSISQSTSFTSMAGRVSATYTAPSIPGDYKITFTYGSISDTIDVSVATPLAVSPEND